MVETILWQMAPAPAVLISDSDMSEWGDYLTDWTKLICSLYLVPAMTEVQRYR